MCDPSGFFAQNADKIIMASSAISSIGNMIEGRQTQTFYNFRGEQAAADANYERGAAQVRAGKIRKAGTLQQGEVRAQYGGSGIDVNRGTPIATAGALERNIGEDMKAQLLTGERRAQQVEQQGAMDRQAGVRARASGSLAASRSLLSGVAASMDAGTKRDKWIRQQALDFQKQKQAEFAMGGGFEDGEF